MSDFDTYYADNPWEAVTTNQREWYYPAVAMKYMQNSVLANFVPWTFNLRNVGARYAHITEILTPGPTANPLGMRQMWVKSSHIDSREVTVTFQHYGGKLTVTEFDQLVTYWQTAGPRKGLMNIINSALGFSMLETMDFIARNAYVYGAWKSGYNLWANPDANKTGFSKITGNPDDHRFHLNSVLDIWLGMLERGVVNGIGSNGAAGTVYCVTTPGVIYDIQKEIMSGNANDEWIAVQNYANPQMVMNYEIGQYKGVRFIQSPRLILRNAGVVDKRGTVVAPFHAGDGAPDPGTTTVDGAYKVGQPGATHYLEIKTDGNWSWDDVQVGDIATIHFTTASEFAPDETIPPLDWRDSDNQDRRIVSIDVDANDNTKARVAFDKPVFVDGTEDLGNGVYAYFTIGDDVHASLFIGAPNGVVGAVSRPPRFHDPRPADDFEGMYRLTWNGWFGLNLFNPEAFEVVFSRGSTRLKGAVRA